jgi:hypothetical protein
MNHAARRLGLHKTWSPPPCRTGCQARRERDDAAASGCAWWWPKARPRLGSREWSHSAAIPAWRSTSRIVVPQVWHNSANSTTSERRSPPSSSGRHCHRANSTCWASQKARSWRKWDQRTGLPRRPAATACSSATAAVSSGNNRLTYPPRGASPASGPAVLQTSVAPTNRGRSHRRAQRPGRGSIRLALASGLGCFSPRGVTPQITLRLAARRAGFKTCGGQRRGSTSVPAWWARPPPLPARHFPDGPGFSRLRFAASPSREPARPP